MACQGQPQLDEEISIYQWNIQKVSLFLKILSEVDCHIYTNKPLCLFKLFKPEVQHLFDCSILFEGCTDYKMNWMPQRNLFF